MKNINILTLFYIFSCKYKYSYIYLYHKQINNRVMKVTFDNIAAKAQEIVNSIFKVSTTNNYHDFVADFKKHSIDLSIEDDGYVVKASRINKLGRRVRVFNYRFSTLSRRDEFLKEQLSILNSRKDRKEIEKTIKKTAKNPYKVGDILHYQFGYSMTLNDYYQIVDVKGMSITIRKIASEIISGDAGYCGYERAVKDSFVDDKLIKKRVQVKIYGGNINYRISHENGTLQPANLVKGEYFNRID